MKNTVTILILLALLAAVTDTATAQTVINAYARVTAQSGTALTISNLSGTFSAGDEALLIQMQDDVIGANTTNVASFGDLSSIQSAGLYERVVLTAAGPTSATLAIVPTATFNYSVNTRVQLVSFPDLGAGGNFTTTASLGALAWTGNVGGVLAFRVGGTLTLAHNLVADGKGFRGGTRNSLQKYVACDASTYVDAGVTYNWYANKGEGIYNSNGAYSVGRGHLLNGGGGGNDVNAGGGGGGNFTAGGVGGPGYSGAAIGCSPGAGGLGGVGLSANVSSNRVFMGGGGGGGQQNDNLATVGGAGGGLILVRAAALKTLAGCSGGAITVSANGAVAGNSGNDGAGGGGAGGAIVLQMSSYALACPLKLSASGGNGGNVATTSGTHGGGGGGGQGVVILANTVSPPSNLTISVIAGLGGANSSNTGFTSASPGVTAMSTPLLLTANQPLPVVLTRFAAVAEGRATLLSWATASEHNSDRFEVERARNSPVAFERIGSLAGAGNSSISQVYEFREAVAPAGTCYYRLRQVDAAGTVNYSPVRVVQRASAAAEGLALYPNPAQASVTLDLSTLAPDASTQIVVRDLVGREVLRLTLPAGTPRPVLDLQKLTPGLYQVLVEQAGRRYVQRLTKE